MDKESRERSEQAIKKIKANIDRFARLEMKMSALSALKSCIENNGANVAVRMDLGFVDSLTFETLMNRIFYDAVFSPAEKLALAGRMLPAIEKMIDDQRNEALAIEGTP